MNTNKRRYKIRVHLWFKNTYRNPVILMRIGCE